MKKLKHITLAFLVSTITLLTFSCIPKSSIVNIFTEINTTNIRVLLGKEKNLKLSSTGKIFFANSIPLNKDLNVEISKTNIVINGIPLGESVDIYSDGNIIFNENEYAGFFRLILKKNQIFVINVLDIEEYLESVVPSEVPALWPMEVLKAQAIVSRTYALRKIIENKDKDYDVLASYKSQVYSGKKKIHPRTTRAVRETRGITITHNGEIVFAFFHANSGGLIESPEIIGLGPLSYLKPTIDKFSKDTFRSYWTTSIPKEEFLYSIFKKQSLKLTQIEIPSRMPSGSVKQIIITVKDTQKEFTKTIDVNKLREIFPSILSPKFEVAIEQDRIIFRGYGWGHGVGMSQWGAKEMASQGYNYKEIIKYYYKNTELSKLY